MAGRMYRLEVESELSDPSATVFEGMTLRYERGNTVVTGPIRDQAELQGLLQRISDLGLTLVNVSAVTGRSAGGSPARSPGREQV